MPDETPAGGQTPPAAAPAGEQKPPEQPQTPTTENPAGPNGGQGDEPKFTQAQLDAAIKDRLERERKAAETKSAKEREEAEATRLKEQAAWEQLATKHEATVKELQPQVETLTAERDQLTAIVGAAIDAETKDWAAEVKALLPADSDVLTRYAAVERTRALAARLAGTPPPQGNGPNPKPTGGTGATDQQARDRVAAFTQSRF